MSHAETAFNDLEEIWTRLPVAIFACFYPITIALIQGQDSILMLTLVVAAFVAHRNGNDLWAGIFVRAARRSLTEYGLAAAGHADIRTRSTPSRLPRLIASIALRRAALREGRAIADDRRGSPSLAQLRPS